MQYDSNILKENTLNNVIRRLESCGIDVDHIRSFMTKHNCWITGGFMLNSFGYDNTSKPNTNWFGKEIVDTDIDIIVTCDCSNNDLITKTCANIASFFKSINYELHIEYRCEEYSGFESICHMMYYTNGKVLFNVIITSCDIITFTNDFDLDCCKIATNLEIVYVYDIDSIVQCKSMYRLLTDYTYDKLIPHNKNTFDIMLVYIYWLLNISNCIDSNIKGKSILNARHYIKSYVLEYDISATNIDIAVNNVVLLGRENCDKYLVSKLTPVELETYNDIINNNTMTINSQQITFIKYLYDKYSCIVHNNFTDVFKYMHNYQWTTYANYYNFINSYVDLNRYFEKLYEKMCAPNCDTSNGTYELFIGCMQNDMDTCTEYLDLTNKIYKSLRLVQRIDKYRERGISIFKSSDHLYAKSSRCIDII